MRLFAGFTAVVVAGCMVGGIDDHDHTNDPPGPQPTSPTVDSIAGGDVYAMPPYAGIAGRALMARHLDGTTYLSVAMTGVAPGVMYTAHLHAAPCRFGGGGGHYKIDPTVADTIETNELWLRGTSSASGLLISDGSFNHLARGGALSIVVHDPMMAGAKMACADLYEDYAGTVEFAGTVAPFAAATAADMTVTGSITATRSTPGSSFMLTLGGLDRTAVGYSTHIHAEPCAVATGGGHYKLDPTAADNIQGNELWLPVTNHTTGMASSMLAVPHVFRTDAQSIVLHRTITDLNKPKVACADLRRTTAHPPFDTSGSAIALPGAAGMSPTGFAVITRRLTGVTEAALVLAGLAPNTKYVAHVHNQSCAVETGGGHFKFDRAVPEALTENEIWFDFRTEGDGTAHDSTWVPRIAGADATSVVVHGADNARLVCFDLR